MKYIWLDPTLPYITLFVFIIPVSSDGGWGGGRVLVVVGESCWRLEPIIVYRQ